MTDDECFVTMSTPVSNHGERGYITKRCETRGNDLIKKKGHFLGFQMHPEMIRYDNTEDANSFEQPVSHV
jgi:histone acetyltransferase (RNA polymerase elongator complex component)